MIVSVIVVQGVWWLPYPPARLLLCVLLDPIPLKKNSVNIGLKNDCHFLKCELAAAARQYRIPQGVDVSVTSFPCEMQFHFSPSALLGDIPCLVWKFRFKRICLGKVVIIFCGQFHKKHRSRAEQSNCPVFPALRVYNGRSSTMVSGGFGNLSNIETVAIVRPREFRRYISQSSISVCTTKVEPLNLSL